MAAGGAGAASAATAVWQHDHPRRVEVNHRLDHINRSIRRERREGELSAYHARRMHERAHMIRIQERRFARQDGGHLTGHAQARLDHEEGGPRRHVPA